MSWVADISCLMCGRPVGSVTLKTESDAYRLPSTLRCQGCGGSIMTEADRRRVESVADRIDPAEFRVARMRKDGQPDRRLVSNRASKERSLCVGSGKKSHSGICLTCKRSWPKLPHGRAFALPRHFINVESPSGRQAQA